MQPKLTPYLMRCMERIDADGWGHLADLLQDFGRWARTQACKGFPGGHGTAEPYLLDDQSALVIDAAWGELRRAFPQIERLLRMYYIQGRDLGDIYSVLRRRGGRKRRAGAVRRKDFYAVDLVTLGAQLCVNEQHISRLIDSGTMRIYRTLKEWQTKTQGVALDRRSNIRQRI